MQPIRGEFGAMNTFNGLLNDHQIPSLRSHGQLPQFDPVDDFVEQILSSAAVYSISSGAANALMFQHHGVDGNALNSIQENDASIKALFTGSLGQTSNQPQVQNGIATPAVTNEGAGQARQRVRARRGQATDPHSIAERLRRERIAERMKSLQELVPNANKTDKASMLDEIIDYVKFLQIQVKVLSMSRLGGASPAHMSSETSKKEGMSMSVTTEKEVTKLMEEDMGSAMQYLQGKGLCLMPISLATAISTNTLKINPNSDAQAPTSPTLSVLTIGGNTDIIRDICNP